MKTLTCLALCLCLAGVARAADDTSARVALALASASKPAPKAVCKDCPCGVDGCPCGCCTMKACTCIVRASASPIPPCKCGCMETGQCRCKNCCERTADPTWKPVAKKPVAKKPVDELSKPYAAQWVAEGWTWDEEKGYWWMMPPTALPDIDQHWPQPAPWAHSPMRFTPAFQPSSGGGFRSGGSRGGC